MSKNVSTIMRPVTQTLVTKKTKKIRYPQLPVMYDATFLAEKEARVNWGMRVDAE